MSINTDYAQYKAWGQHVEPASKKEVTVKRQVIPPALLTVKLAKTRGKSKL